MENRLDSSTITTTKTAGMVQNFHFLRVSFNCLMDRECMQWEPSEKFLCLRTNNGISVFDGKREGDDRGFWLGGGGV